MMNVKTIITWEFQWSRVIFWHRIFFREQNQRRFHQDFSRAQKCSQSARFVQLTHWCLSLLWFLSLLRSQYHKCNNTRNEKYAQPVRFIQLHSHVSSRDSLDFDLYCYAITHNGMCDIVSIAKAHFACIWSLAWSLPWPFKCLPWCIFNK